MREFYPLPSPGEGKEGEEKEENEEWFWRPRTWSMTVSSLDSIISFNTGTCTGAKEVVLGHIPGSGSISDWRLLQMGWACADAILGSGAILRQEPSVKWKPIDQDLLSFRKNVLKKTSLPLNVILSGSGEIEVGHHPIFTDPELKTLIITTEAGANTIKKKEAEAEARVKAEAEARVKAETKTKEEAEAEAGVEGESQSPSNLPLGLPYSPMTQDPSAPTAPSSPSTALSLCPPSPSAGQAVAPLVSSHSNNNNNTDKHKNNQKKNYVVEVMGKEIDFLEVMKLLKFKYKVNYLDVTAGGEVIGQMVYHKLIDEVRLTLAGQLIGDPALSLFSSKKQTTTTATATTRPHFFTPPAGFEFQVDNSPLLNYLAIRLFGLHHLFVRAQVVYRH
eukprot:TRINITY_DN2634_c0_g1_i1.p1 TRINITY_DN2634_c0_g1~~TRINITY_DN2634_c0_g1_i1.p1  ORF type:complete len:440 (+),score=149.67 TRINITY_DN2634_c0_g1_i1:152-1321(+)